MRSVCPRTLKMKLILLLVIVFSIVVCLYGTADVWKVGSGKKEEGFCRRHSTCGNTHLKYNFLERSFHFEADGEPYLVGTLPAKLHMEDPQACATESESDLCVQFSRFTKLEVKLDVEEDIVCNTITWTPSSLDFIPQDCLLMEGAHWYGGSELHTHLWPLQKVSLPMQPYVPNDLYPSNASYGNVLERYWINSLGVGLTVDESVPLYVSINRSSSHQLCLKSAFINDTYPHHYSDKPILKYTVCKGGNVRKIHNYLSRKSFALPKGVPDKRMMKSPIWSTWAKFKTAVNQTSILKFADEITQNGFSNSQLEIDDMYSSHYGEFDFSPVKFKDAFYMVGLLKEKGFRVTVWITPFANLDAPIFQTGMDKGYWLKDSTGQVPALVKWWQGIGGMLDVTNIEAVEWFVFRLKKMQRDYGIDSFKFDAGETTFMPPLTKPNVPWKNPSFYATKYVQAVSALGTMIEVRCGFQSQQYPVFVRMGDKDSKWGHDNGLKSMIPATLTLGILGYPFILPDMIGGNGYTDQNWQFNVGTLLPSKELFIRWLQISAYMPSMQFSFVPWQYDQEVVEIAKKMVRIHEEVVFPMLLKTVEETQKTGAPLIRPLWWLNPDDETSQRIDCEFMVGDELLVSPIMDDGARERDVYLPPGKWRDQLRDRDVIGPQWMRNYRVELADIATFRRL